MAPSRRSTVTKVRATSRRSKVSETNKDQSQNVSSSSEEKPFLLLEDVTCKICLNLMVKPVSLPCRHDLCYSCYSSCVEKSNLSCPMCRKRISVWCRQATKTNSVINEVLWQQIQAQFPELVASQNGDGKDEKDVEDFFPTVPMHQFAEPGELLKEFEIEQERRRREEEERRKEEEKASADLIAELAKEQAELARAEAELERIRQADEALALELAEKEDNIRKLRGSRIVQTPISSRKRPRKMSSDSKTTPAAKKINKFFPSRSNENDEPSRSPSAFAPVTEHFQKRDISMSEPRSSSCTSLESIDQEVSKRLHFRPINAAPLTPPKNSPGNSEIVKPQVVSAAKNLNQLYGLDEENLTEDLKQNNNSEEPIKGAGILAEELREMEREWLRKKIEQEEADKELARKLQEELDQEAKSTRSLVNRSKGSKDEYQLRTKIVKNQPTIEASFQRPSIRKSNPPP